MQYKQVLNHQTSSKELHLISCGWEKCTPEQSYGPGVRRYYTIHFVLSGQGYFYMNNRKYTIKAGQCFFIPPVTSSLYKAEPSDPWTYIWICFNGENAPMLCEHCHLTEETPIEQWHSVLPYQETILEMMTHPQLTPSAKLISRAVFTGSSPCWRKNFTLPTRPWNPTKIFISHRLLITSKKSASGYYCDRCC